VAESWNGILYVLWWQGMLIISPPICVRGACLMGVYQENCGVEFEREYLKNKEEMAREHEEMIEELDPKPAIN